MKGNAVKTHTRNQRALGLRRVTVVGATLAVLVTGACGGTPATPIDKSAPNDSMHQGLHAAPAVFADDAYLDNASAYIDAAKDTWEAKATTVKIELKEMS